MTNISRKQVFELDNELAALADDDLIFVERSGLPYKFPARGIVDETSINSVGDGTFSQANVDAMVTAVGYVQVTTPKAVAANVTVTAPIYFKPGAYLTAASGVTVTLQNYVTAPKEWVFRGDGTYDLDSSGYTGEVARIVYPGWFNVFPGDTSTATTTTAGMNAMFTAVGNSREAYFPFDVGNYHMNGATTPGRGANIYGTGTRKTVFFITGDGFVPFTTNETAVHFERIQFEHSTQLTTERTSPYIRLNHTYCIIRDVIAGRAKCSFEVAENGCIVEDVSGFFNVNGSSGSCLVGVQSSNNIIRRVDGLRSSGFGPDSLVHIGYDMSSGEASISGNTVEDVKNGAESIGVLVEANVCTVNRTHIKNVQSGPATGPHVGIHLLANNASYSIAETNIQGGLFADAARSAVKLEAAGGTLRDTMIDGVMAAGSTGTGFELVRSSGTLTTVVIGPGCFARDKANPASYSGTMSDVTVHPNVFGKGGSPFFVEEVSIADDDVYTIPAGYARFAGILMICTNDNRHVIARARAASTPALSAFSGTSANGITLTTGVLTGTTGADTAMTASVDTAGNIYVENRLGSASTVTLVRF